MKYESSEVQSMYKEAQKQLCSVDKLADVVLFAASASEDKAACSQTARLGFGALTGGCITKAGVEPTRFMLNSTVPSKSAAPSVTYVSLTGDYDLFTDTTGHRFLVLQCHDYVRVLQACRDECTVAEFVTEAKYAAVATAMTYETFVGWWEELVCALRTPFRDVVYNHGDLWTDPKTDPPRASGQVPPSRADAVAKVLGVPYGDKTEASWFYQKAVQF